MKYKLFLSNKNNTEDIFKFDSKKELFQFLIDLMSEKMIDTNFVEMEYSIIVVEG